MLLSGAFAGSEWLAVVGSLAVQWSLADGDAAHASVSVRITEHGVSSPGEVQLARATLSADALFWSCGEECATLHPHARHTLRVALHDAGGSELTAAAVLFRAGPHGLAGDPAGGWTASSTGGASVIAAAIDRDLRPALAEGETLAQTTLHALSPQTMSWQLANGSRLHDSVLDRGYLNQPDRRSIYVAYDLSDFHAAGFFELTGRLGFGKYGYLGQWCHGTAHAMTAAWKPVSPQVVSTTSADRVLIVGTGSAGIVELKGGAVIARWGTGVREAAATGANTWRGRADGAPLVYSNLYHGETYDATQEAGGAPMTELQPWNTTEQPMGPLAPHAFPTIRPSYAPVGAVKAWVPPPKALTGGPLSVVFDFGNNYAATCELTIEGDTSALTRIFNFERK